MKVEILERCLRAWIDREMGYNVDTVEDKIQNGILSAFDRNITSSIESALRLTKVSSGRNFAGVSANSQRGEHIGITCSLENASDGKNTIHDFDANDETCGNIPDEVDEISVSKTHFDRQSHSNRMVTEKTINANQIPEFLTGKTFG